MSDLVPNWQASWSCVSYGAEQTRSLGERLGATVRPGTIIGLVGEMGAGKTTLVQGMAGGWGVVDVLDVTSPTYTLVNEYDGRQAPLLHLDLYRLADIDAARALGLDDVVARAAGLVIVEWADKMPDLLPPHASWLRLTCSRADGRMLQGFNIAYPHARAT